MTNEQYQKEYIKLHNAYEKRAFSIFKKSIKNIVAKIPVDNLTKENAELTVMANLDTAEIKKAYVKMYKSIGLSHGKWVLRQVALETKNLSLFEQIFKDTLLGWMGLNVGQRIISVNQTLAQAITNLIIGNFNNELNIVQIRNLIQKKLNLSSFYKWQTMRIVRTETTTISNYATLKASEASKVVFEKEWIATIDARTRRLPISDFDHLRMNEVRIAREDFFNVNGDLIEYPGDPRSIFAENIINCRCTFRLIPKRDRNGLPIMRN